MSASVRSAKLSRIVSRLLLRKWRIRGRLHLARICTLVGDNDSLESWVVSDIPYIITTHQTTLKTWFVNLLTKLRAVSVAARCDRFESRVSIAICPARPSKGGRGVAVRRTSVMREWPERRDLGRGERSDGLASLKERGGRDGDGERQEGKSELQGNHDCEVCTTGGLW